MLLYHPINKTYDDFDEVYRYHLYGPSGLIIETDKKLIEGQVIILKDIREYAIVVDKIWEQLGELYFTHYSAEEIVVRARVVNE